jgi:uncharacterized repeat protein (TIGR01451 family)
MGCDPVTNSGNIVGPDIVNVRSNEVVMFPDCPEPETWITKTASVATGAIGDFVTYTIAYQNVGTRDVDPYEIWDVLPAGQLLYVAGSASNGGNDTGGGNLYWNLGLLPVGGSGTVTFVAEIIGFPYNPLMGKFEYLAYLNDKTKLLSSAKAWSLK